MQPDARRLTRRNRRVFIASAVIGILFLSVAPVWGSMFGEENTTLVQMLVQLIGIQKEKVVRRNLTELVVANGKIQPVTQVKISPEVSGEILASV